MCVQIIGRGVQIHTVLIIHYILLLDIIIYVDIQYMHDNLYTSFYNV